MERKAKTLTWNWRDHWKTGKRKHMETVSRYLDRHGCLYQSEKSKCLWTHDKYGIIFVVCSQTFTLFELIKTAVPVEISWYSFRVPVLQWSLQFQVRVFTFLSLILQYSYFGNFLFTLSEENTLTHFHSININKK